MSKLDHMLEPEMGSVHRLKVISGTGFGTHRGCTRALRERECERSRQRHRNEPRPAPAGRRTGFREEASRGGQ